MTATYTEPEVRAALADAFARGKAAERAEHATPGTNGHAPAVKKAVAADGRAELEAYRAAESAYRAALAAVRARAADHADAADAAESAARAALRDVVTAGGRHGELFDALTELAGSYNPAWSADTKRTHFKDAEHALGLFQRENRRRQADPGSLSAADLAANDGHARRALAAVGEAMTHLVAHRAALATWAELGGSDPGSPGGGGVDPASPVSKAVTYVESEHPRAADGKWVAENGPHITKRHVDDARGDKGKEDELRRVVHPDDREILESHLRNVPDADQRVFTPERGRHSNQRNQGWAKGSALAEHVGGYLDRIKADGPLSPDERRDLTVAVGNALRSARLPELRNMARSVGVKRPDLLGKEELQAEIRKAVAAALWEAEYRYHDRTAVREEGDEFTARPDVPARKAWEESEHPRDHGKFAEKGGKDGGRGEPAQSGNKMSDVARPRDDLIREAGVPIRGADRLTDDRLALLADVIAGSPVKPRRVVVTAGRGDYFGQHHPISGELKIAADALDPDRLAAALEAAGVSMADPTPRGVLNHELGHALHARYGIPKDILDDPGVKKWSESLSGQAALHPDEAVAEWYAAAMTGRDIHPKVRQWWESKGVTFPAAPPAS